VGRNNYCELPDTTMAATDDKFDAFRGKGYPGNLTDQLGAWYAAGMPV
jgi:hypothetical protein